MLASCNIDMLFTDGGTASGGGQDGPSSGQEVGEVRIEDFRFGKVVELEDRGETLSAWRDSVTMESVDDRVDITPGGAEIDWGDLSAYKYEVVDYADTLVPLRLVVYPSDASVRSLSVVSSDPSLLKIERGAGHFDFTMTPKGVGDVTVRVKVDDGERVIAKSYRLRIMAKVGLKVYLDRYWRNPSLTRIMYRCTELPDNMECMVFTIRDSVEVDAECSWKDVRNGLYTEQTRTITYGMKGRTRDRVFRKDMRIGLEDFSEAFDYISRQYVMGSDFIGDTDETCDVKYDYYPTKVRLHLDVCPDNPYIAFDLVVKGNDYVRRDESFRDTTDDGMVSDTDLMEHYEVGFCRGMTEQEKEKLMDALQERLEEVGSSEEDQQWLDEIFEGLTPEEVEAMLESIRSRKEK